MKKQTHQTNAYSQGFQRLNKISNFYRATQKNDVKSVRKRRSKSHYTSLNNLGSDDSTTLHATTLLGHIEDPPILSYHLDVIPNNCDYDEVISIDETRRLFDSAKHSPRFCGWELNCNARSQTLQRNDNSKFYSAVERGDAKSVRELGSMLDHTDLNNLEANGRTALHAAASLGHIEVVRILLHDFDVMRHYRDRDGRTAYEVASTDEIRRLFHRPSPSSRFCDSALNDDENCCIEEDKKENDPKSIRWIEKIEGKDEINLMKTGVRFMKYAPSSSILRPIALEIGRMSDPRKRYHDQKMVVEIMRDVIEKKLTSSHKHYQKACNLLDEYEKTSNIIPLCQLYTMNTPFYSYMSKNTSGLFGLCYGLNQLKSRAFHGTSYRGLSMTREDLQEYQWALQYNEKRAFYSRSFYSSSVDRCVADMFSETVPSSDKIRVLMVFDFPTLCDSAFQLYKVAENLPCISEFEDENEVLIGPGTLFQVTKIDTDEDSKKCTIYLRNILDEWKLFPLVKCVWNGKKMLRKISG